MSAVRDIRECRLRAYQAAPRDILAHYRDEEAEKKAYAGRALFELLQNGDDAMAALGQGGEILVAEESGVLYVANQGAPFSRVGLEALCDRGISPKRGLDFMGSRGIGFKAVLGWTDAPRIVSGGICAEFSRARSTALIKDTLSPLQLSGLERDHRWTEDQVPLLRLPFDHELDATESRLRSGGWTTIVALPIVAAKMDEVASALAEFDRRHLVFLRHLHELRFECNRLRGSIRIERRQKTKERFEVNISDGTRGGQQLHYSMQFVPDAADGPYAKAVITSETPARAGPK